MIFKIKSKFDEHDVNGSVSFAFSFCFGGKCFLFREIGFQRKKFKLIGKLSIPKTFFGV
jgi:hypothetical protein